MAKSKKSNEDLKQDAIDAVNALFSDQSVSQEQCRENLEEVVGEIETMLESMRDSDE